MKFKDLTDEEIIRAKEIHSDMNLSWDEKMSELIELFGRSERTVRKWLVKLGIKKKDIEDSPQLKKAKKRKFDKSKKRFIITWAQCSTPVHERFLRNIEAYAEEINADIHVIAGRYKNPTSVFTEKDFDTWHSRVEPYLDANRHDIHKYVSIMSDVKIQPTAVNPMTGLQGMSGVNSCIFGSPKLQMETIPVLESGRPKMMLTTGACTLKNYTDSKAGKKGEFHHTIGFCVVEIKDISTFFVRQVSALENGDFSDLYYNVRFNGEFNKESNEWKGRSIIERNKKMAACVLGDIHYGLHDQEVIDSTLSLFDEMEPEHVILHDVFDGYSISHHDMKDPFSQYAKEVHNTNNLRTEVENMLDGLQPFEKFNNVVIVRSNHDDFIDRWLKNGDWKKQPTPKNSPAYMEYSSILLNQYAETPEDVKGVIPELINRRYPKFKTLGRRDSHRVNNWELGQHGDMGFNGSRGSLLQFRKLNTKIVVGHYHSPGRKDGALAVGTSTKLRVGYNLGPSSWLQSHVIIHNNGKAQHINFINGEYTTFE